MNERWEYRVVFNDSWRRISVEGSETHPEEGERASAFGRRMLNSMGIEGWELSAVHPTMPGQAYYIFKRRLADGNEPDMTVVRHSEEQPASEPAAMPTSGETYTI